MNALLLRLVQRHVTALAHIHQPVTVPAPRAQEEAAVRVDLGGHGPEHHGEAAGSAGPHGVAPVGSHRTPVWQGPSWSWPADPHERRQYQRDLEAQARQQDRGY